MCEFESSDCLCCIMISMIDASVEKHKKKIGFFFFVLFFNREHLMTPEFNLFFSFISQDMIQYHHGGRAIPAIWFRYELSPITVRYKEKRPPFYTFLTTVSHYFFLIFFLFM